MCGKFANIDILICFAILSLRHQLVVRSIAQANCPFRLFEIKPLSIEAVQTAVDLPVGNELKTARKTGVSCLLTPLFSLHAGIHSEVGHLPSSSG